ncbi:MAG TPA: GGDEF domain-containing phosphodiesterase, partial [Gammaproteobacteria bacterium]|nr:GGDEF domain-containing phosphodiesterase [Gammaproteobacteria bacterium]
QRADDAMYRAKEAGRNTYRFHGEGGPAVEVPEVGEEELIRALEHDELALAYQPYYRRGGAIAGFEALLRWRHPEHGELAPAHFLPLAEQCDLILAVGDWVLRRACRQARRWNANRPDAPLGLAVNLSRRQLVDPRFAERVGRVLAATGFAPQLLELDAAESILLGDLAPLMQNLSHLRTLGVRIAVDDFGGGLGGLERLRELPVDAVKIDRSCVSRLTDPGPDQNAAESVIAQAHRLHMEVFAEGVETPEQLHFLQNHACDHTQGFYHQRPVAAEEVEGLLESDPR